MYTNSLYQAHRRKTRPVFVGDLGIGGHHPILVQSMTTTPTTDTDATVAQIETLVKHGCPLVRLTVPRQMDVDNLKNITKAMHAKHLDVPLVADIHFLPKLALQACNYVQKVRINPGNFADRKRFDVKEYTDKQYELELERVAEEFVPIVQRAKQNGVALRIGTNHGSLSDRIMNRYGDTPKGMVESALEFVRIAQAENFHSLVLSMKSSNPMVMIQAYRLLVDHMNQLSWDYPLHLGVTEAGDGVDGRVKSSIGISSLLFDGLGDTIRVSLTEDPEKEIPVALEIANLFSKQPLDDLKVDSRFETFKNVPSWDPFTYQRRLSTELDFADKKLGGSNLVAVRGYVAENKLPQTGVDIISTDSANWLPQSDLFTISRLKQTKVDKSQADGFSILVNQTWTHDVYLEKLKNWISGKQLWLRVEKPEQIAYLIELIKQMDVPVGVEISGVHLISLARAVVVALSQENLNPPIHLHIKTLFEETMDQVMLRASAELGSLLCDGIGDSIEVESQDPQISKELAFSVLQSTRLRMTRTDYISCPSCGRTLFDLQETTARIREKTNHLVGVKIAIMGCIVNGPGEMADADFGYVGSGPGKINLYVGKTCVEKNIDQSLADQKLIELIKQHGRWCEPKTT